jgi:hypothetical protein
MVAINYDLGRYTFLVGGYGNRYSVFIGTTYEEHFLTGQAFVAHIQISGQVGTCEMAKMNGSVGIGQGRCNENSFRHILLKYKFKGQKYDGDEPKPKDKTMPD